MTYKWDIEITAADDTYCALAVRGKVATQEALDDLIRALQASRPLLASVDTLPEGQDSATGLVRSKGSAVGASRDAQEDAVK